MITSSFVVLLSTLLSVASALAAAPTTSPITKSYLVTGANKGQGLALCQRILTEHPAGNDAGTQAHVFLCSRDTRRGEEAKRTLLEQCAGVDASRVDVIQLDVTDVDSVTAASKRVRQMLGEDKKLSGVVSNAGILWGHTLPQLMDVCATGVRRVLDAFVPLVEDDGRVIVVTSGLGPLMHSYASEERQAALKDVDSSWDEAIAPMICDCLGAYARTEGEDPSQRIAAFDELGFPGGPFAEAAPDFHMYGLAKMMGDAYMRRMAHRYPNLRVTSVDPGLVYTDLILRMPKYAGLKKEETTAQSPHEGVEGTVRLLFDESEGLGKGVGTDGGSGKLYALTKERKLVFGEIDTMPQKQ